MPSILPGNLVILRKFRDTSHMAKKRRGRPRSPAVALRRVEALKLRTAGYTYRDIADKLGYSTPSAGCQDVQRALKELVREQATETAALELERLDALLIPLWGKAQRGNLAATDRVLRLMERRSRYLGLDHGDRPDHDPAVVDEWIKHVMGTPVLTSPIST